MIYRYRRLVLIASALIFSAALLTLQPHTAAAFPSMVGFQAEVAHLALTLEDQSLWVALEVDLANNGKEPSPPFEIPIPAEATNFEAVEGNVTRTGDRVTVPGGTPAGEKVSIGFRYKLPPGVLRVPFPDVPPAGLSMIMLDESVLTLVSPTGQGVTDQGLIPLGSRAYREFDITRPAPGMTLTVQVKPGGDPAAASKALANADTSATATNERPLGGNPNAIMRQRLTSLPGKLLTGLVLALVLILLVRRFRGASHSRTYSPAYEPDDDSELSSLRQQKADLARRIARMDIRAAESPTADLARQRAEAKQQLVQVILRLKRLESQSE